MGIVEIVFDIAHICLFNALLLRGTSLNGFMSKNRQQYVANTDTSHRVLRFPPPSPLFKVTRSFEAAHTVPGGVRFVLFARGECENSSATKCPKIDLLPVCSLLTLGVQVLSQKYY